jgi:transcriptional regulator with XRE-family HTH domain
MEQPQLGLKISELRKQKGLTQEELVDQCNINVRTLQRIESGEVSPRSYTVKTILSALDYDYESLQPMREIKNEAKLSFIPAKEAKTIVLLLTASIIAGMVYMVAGIFDGFSVWYRITDDEYIFGKLGYSISKIILIISYIIFFYGFLISGRLLENYLMKIAVVLCLVSSTCYFLYDLLSVYYPVLDKEVVFLAGAIASGGLILLFGISVLKSKHILGNLGLAAGVLEVVLGICFLSVILSPLALVVIVPVNIFEILVLYRIVSMVKDQM